MSATIKSILQDIIDHTYNLGVLTTVKVTGTEEQTKIESMADNRAIVMTGEIKNPEPSMIGLFGMPQMNKLKYLFDCPEYKEDATINIVNGIRNGVNVLTGVHFENKAGDFKNDYQFMLPDAISEKHKSPLFMGVKWDVTISPTLTGIQRFGFQAAANNEHTTFLTTVDGDKLKFVFGDVSTHGGEFVFGTGVSGHLNKERLWPVIPVLSILKIADVNNTTMRFSNSGAIEIELDSGIAVYKYIIPAVL
jgi:hypothetical protein